jgi:hypothetical protein
MRLVGGNISDSPVKEIGDGSAFAVGGSSSEPPSLIDFGTPGTAATFSNIGGCTTNMGYGHSPARSIGGKNMDICVWSPLSTSVFYVDSTDSHKLKHVRLSFNADGTLASEGAEQDLNSLMAIGTNKDMICVNKVSSTRCTLTRFKEASTTAFIVACLDLSGDSVSLHGALQTRTTTWNSTLAFVGGACTVLLDSDHLGLFAHRSDGGLPEMSIIKFTTTQSVGAWTVGTDTVSWTADSGSGGGGMADYDPDSGKVFWFDGAKMYTEWTWSGTTATYGQKLLTASEAAGWQYGNMRGGEAASKFRHDIEPGRMLSASQQLWQGGATNTHFMFAGRVTKGQRRITINPYAALVYADSGTNQYYLSYFGHMRGESTSVDYDEDTYWERQFCPGSAGGNLEAEGRYVRIFPTAINWSTGAAVAITASDLQVVDMGSGFAASLCGPLCWLTGDAETTIFIIKPGQVSGSDVTKYNTVTFTK